MRKGLDMLIFHYFQLIAVYMKLPIKKKPLSKDLPPRLYRCDAKDPWDPDNIPAIRLNFSVLFGLMKVQFQEIIR